MKPFGRPEVGDIVRGKFVYRGSLTGTYFVGNARRVTAIHDDGQFAFEVVGQKWDVTHDVQRLIQDALGAGT